MKHSVSLPRITVVADSHLEKSIIQEMTRLGAKGYTCWDCRGRGEHEILQDIFKENGRVRIEAILQPDVAQSIWNYLHQAQFEHQAVCACVDFVQVAAPDKF